MLRSLAPFVVCCAAILCSPESVTAQPYVEINQSPELIEGSLEGGRNLIVTATINGATADDVWLALVDGTDRVKLTRAGPFRYQVNLCRGAAARLLRREGAGELAVFARNADGTAHSVPIAFDVEPATGPSGVRSVPSTGPAPEWQGDPVAAGPRRFFTRIVAREARQRVHAFSVRPSDEVWMVPEDIVAIEANALFDEPLAGAVLLVDDRSWPLVEKGRRIAHVPVGEELARAWRASGVATLRFESGREALLRVVPRELPAGEAYRFLMGQRHVLELPGTGGQLHVALGDVTRGQVRLRVFDAEERPLVRGTSLQVNDRVEFRYQGRGYVLVVEDLVNFLIGDDQVWLSVCRIDE